jgi:hypothetical protein
MGKEKPEKKGKGRTIFNLIIIILAIGLVFWLLNQYGGACGLDILPI